MFRQFVVCLLLVSLSSVGKPPRPLRLPLPLPPEPQPLLPPPEKRPMHLRRQP